MASNTIAQTILAQLGGNRFVAMTGARNMTYSANSLTAQLPRVPGVAVNCLRITLTAMDDYQIEGMNIRGVKCSPAAFKDGVQAENLRGAVSRMIQQDLSL